MGASDKVAEPTAINPAAADQDAISEIVVTADQMQAIENRIFEAGMPVAALMEKVAGRIARRIQSLYPQAQCPRMGVLVGPGHNGGDALVVARELSLQGYQVAVWSPLAHKQKELTASHANYVKSLGVHWIEEIAEFTPPDLWIDVLFGFGLTQNIKGAVAGGIEWINRSNRPVISIDLPSGIHTDTGIVMGTALRAERTLCLGLWKLGLIQDIALEHVGHVELIPFDIPKADIEAVLGDEPAVRRLSKASAIKTLPYPTTLSTHKYRRGHMLLIAGSHKYRGAVLLAAMGARASGVGMLSIAVPESMAVEVSAQVPEAIILSCPETTLGAIERLPDDVNPDSFQAVACGPGLSLEPVSVMDQVLKTRRPLVLDADGLNLLARRNAVKTLRARKALTVLTPHPGEFERLFPDEVETGAPAYSLARKVAEMCGAIIALKGARMVVSRPQGPSWVNSDSSPALARGGSGDVLTGLMTGLMAIAAAQMQDPETVVKTAVWWHAQAGIYGEKQRSVFGVDAWTLSQLLVPALQESLKP